ncbi:MAG: phosphopantothenate/pantothenate synthetase [Candidatus Thorarchaeota archaeon]|nr:MAG: phosphopantothenate/pantothenate synthetase [Candidatus Thorarchaeota archaeon]
MDTIEIPPDHPRRVSLETREQVIEGHQRHIVATAGLLAHGRGEAFDYLIGERTHSYTKLAINAAAAAMLTADHPVISVNGNVCALVPEDLVLLSEVTGAPLEVNLFYYRKEREDAILEALKGAGAKRVLGTHDRPSTTIPELSSNRRRVDPDGIGSADVVLVPLEDGDRTEALRRIGKFVITIDLNPMSRTAIFSNITIVDNIVRCMPLLVEAVREHKGRPIKELKAIVDRFDNRSNLKKSLETIRDHIDEMASEAQDFKEETAQ